MNFTPIPERTTVLEYQDSPRNTLSVNGNVVVIPPCPECEVEGKHTAFKSTAELGRHRSKIHGIPGSSPTARTLRRKKAMAISLASEAGVQSSQGSRDGGKVPSITAENSYANGLAVGQAFEYVRAFLEELALRHGFPIEELTRNIANLLLSQGAVGPLSISPYRKPPPGGTRSTLAC